MSAGKPGGADPSPEEEVVQSHRKDAEIDSISTLSKKTKDLLKKFKDAPIMLAGPAEEFNQKMNGYMETFTTNQTIELDPVELCFFLSDPENISPNTTYMFHKQFVGDRAHFSLMYACDNIKYSFWVRQTKGEIANQPMLQVTNDVKNRMLKQQIRMIGPFTIHPVRVYAYYWYKVAHDKKAPDLELIFEPITNLEPYVNEPEVSRMEKAGDVSSKFMLSFKPCVQEFQLASGEGTETVYFHLLPIPIGGSIADSRITLHIIANKSPDGYY